MKREPAPASGWSSPNAAVFADAALIATLGLTLVCRTASDAKVPTAVIGAGRRPVEEERRGNSGSD